MRKLIYITSSLASLLLFLVLVTVSWFFLKWYVFPITHIEAPEIFNVAPGISTTKLARELHEAELINDPQYFIWFTRFKKDMTNIKTGEYQITPGTTADELLADLVKGKVVMRKLTLIEGWTFNQLIQNLRDNPYIRHTLQGKSPQEIMVAVGHPNQNPEGRFYPDTYLFAQGTSDVKLLTISCNLMQSKLAEAWEGRAPDLPYKTPEDALIVASMVEKEATFVKERPQVAGVILKRLQMGMRLQIDATVIYGRDGNYLKPLRKSDLQKDTPYNTYTRAGLPEGPISMPSESSIQAALQPEISDAVYYVAKGDGSHTFSKNLRGHNKAVTQYRQNLKIKAIILEALNKRSTSPVLMLKYWQNLAQPQAGAVCLDMHTTEFH